MASERLNMVLIMGAALAIKARADLKTLITEKFLD